MNVGGKGMPICFIEVQIIYHKAFERKHTREQEYKILTERSTIGEN